MIEVLKQALTDAKRNERHNNVAETRYWLNQYKLIAEQAIAELESQEPVAWMYVNIDGECEDIGYGKTYLAGLDGCTPLYTHPPQRTWVGLTDDEIYEMYSEPTSDSEMIAFAREVEAKLKEKNT